MSSRRSCRSSRSRNALAYAPLFPPFKDVASSERGSIVVVRVRFCSAALFTRTDAKVALEIHNGFDCGRNFGWVGRGNEPPLRYLVNLLGAVALKKSADGELEYVGNGGVFVPPQPCR